LDRIRSEQRIGLADRLLQIGQDCAKRLKEPYRSVDHDDLLYDDRGLPPMIINITAIIAILRHEPGARDCALARLRMVRRVSAANFVETALVIDRSRDPIASRRFDELFKEAISKLPLAPYEYLTRT
jgi:hypothetical protein